MILECSTCEKQAKPEEGLFYVNNQSKRGYSYLCIECEKLASSKRVKHKNSKKVDKRERAELKRIQDTYCKPVSDRLKDLSSKLFVENQWSKLSN